MVDKITVGSEYMLNSNGEFVEVLEFQTIQLKDDSYQNELDIVIYIDEDSKLKAMEINSFADEIG